jgi:hypothetical protein
MGERMETTLEINDPLESLYEGIMQAIHETTDNSIISNIELIGILEMIKLEVLNNSYTDEVQ